MSRSLLEGSDLKLNIHIDPMDGITMDDYDFTIEILIGQSKSFLYKKSDCIRVDSDNYKLPLNTTGYGSGAMLIYIKAFIPDNDFDDGFRTEYCDLDPQISIRKK
jgi:hypothetical protein